MWNFGCLCFLTRRIRIRRLHSWILFPKVSNCHFELSKCYHALYLANGKKSYCKRERQSKGGEKYDCLKKKNVSIGRAVIKIMDFEVVVKNILRFWRETRKIWIFLCVEKFISLYFLNELPDRDGLNFVLKGKVRGIIGEGRSWKFPKIEQWPTLQVGQCLISVICLSRANCCDSSDVTYGIYSWICHLHSVQFPSRSDNYSRKYSSFPNFKNKKKKTVTKKFFFNRCRSLNILLNCLQKIFSCTGICWQGYYEVKLWWKI